MYNFLRNSKYSMLKYLPPDISEFLSFLSRMSKNVRDLSPPDHPTNSSKAFCNFEPLGLRRFTTNGWNSLLTMTL